MTGAEAAATLRGLALGVRNRATISKAELYAWIGDSLGEGCHSCVRKARDAERKRTERGQNRDGPRTFEGHIRDAARTESGQNADQGEVAPPVPPDPPLIPSGSSLDSPSNSPVLASGQGPVRKRARRKPRAAPDIPAELGADFDAPAELVTALATKYQVTEARIRAVVPEFKWYWREGGGAGKKRTLRGWYTAFGKRIESEAKSGSLYAEPRRNGQASSRDGTVIVKHPVFRPEPTIPASERPSQSEITQMLSKVGRVAT